MFICTGNICRSPVAERLTIALAESAGLKGLQVSSAGTRAVVGQPVHPDSAQAIEEMGGSSAGHVARQVVAKVLCTADFVLTMTTEHRGAVLELEPRILSKTFTLDEAAKLAVVGGVRYIADMSDLRSSIPPDQLLDVPDPFSRPPEAHKSVAETIVGLLGPILDLCRAELMTDQSAVAPDSFRIKETPPLGGKPE